MFKVLLCLLPSLALVIPHFESVYEGSTLEMYKLGKPDKRLQLPDVLKEISGFTILDTNHVLCVQDEAGILYVLDMKKNSISGEYTFAAAGDYEALCKAGNNTYVLRSDGNIFEIGDFKKPSATTQMYVTNIPAMNNEGLCYDQANRRLLIGCKSKAGKGPEFKDLREIYAFDLESKTTSREPVYRFNVQTFIYFAQQNNIKLPLKQKGKSLVPFLKFSTSEIAIHPKSGELYLLSATDHMLFVFDNKGELKKMQQLDPILFNKAEGLDFSANGDLYISNEGQNHKATLLKFKPLSKN